MVKVSQSRLSDPPPTVPMTEFTPLASVNVLGADWLLDKSPLIASFQNIAAFTGAIKMTPAKAPNVSLCQGITNRFSIIIRLSIAN